MKNIYRNENSIILKNEFHDFETGNFLTLVETQNYVIVQVADSYYGSRFCVPSHKQCCDLEITYPLTNGLICATDGVRQTVNKHEVYISYKNDNHELLSNRGCRFQTLAINVKEGECSKLLSAVKENFTRDRKCDIQEISGLFALIVSEFVLRDAPFLNNYLDSLITQILVKLVRLDFYPPEIDFLSTEENLPAIVNYIDAHFLDICSLEELSSHFGYNYGHICKTFRKCYGVTPHNYLNSKKMDYAVMLLSEGKSVKFISEQLRYSSPYNFSRAFKKQYGYSPMNYIAEKLSD